MLQKTISEKRVKFRSTPQKDEFVKVLRKNINDYFEENNISKHANTELWIKIAASYLIWISIYLLIMSDWLSDNPILLIVAFSLLGFANIFITFSSVHDAVHDAISPKKWVNQLLARGMDFVGASSYLLRQMHGEHHKWVNIHGIDVTLETHGLFRFTPHEPWKPLHKFQHLYIPFLYSMAQLQWITFKDFKWFFGESHIGNIKNVKHPLSEYFILFLSKGLYYTLTLVLPLIYLSASWWLILIGWVSIHILSGLTFALIFQCTHICDGTTYPMPDEEGNIENNYALHVLATTADFSRESRIGSWLMGGINIHAIHHIFPTICHVHYQKITPILIQTAKEFGLEYMEFKTFRQAFRNHIKMLRHLSSREANVPMYKTENASTIQMA